MSEPTGFQAAEIGYIVILCVAAWAYYIRVANDLADVIRVSSLDKLMQTLGTFEPASKTAKGRKTRTASGLIKLGLTLRNGSK